jgi:hypothetical protein
MDKKQLEANGMSLLLQHIPLHRQQHPVLKQDLCIQETSSSACISLPYKIDCLFPSAIYTYALGA